MQDIIDIYRRVLATDYSGPLRNKTILLTGSNGFLGRYFTKIFELLNEELDCQINVILMDSYVVPNDQYKTKFRQIQHDISQPIELDLKVDFIINCAGIASPKFYAQFPLETLNVSVEGTKNVLNFANGARTLIFSSSEIYQTPDEANIPTKETYVGQIFPNNPRSVYDIGKLILENLSYIYNTKLNANVVICRPFNFFGSLMSPNDGRVLPAFREKIKNNETITINGSGKQTRSFTHIIDAIDGCFRVLLNGKKGEAYNIGNPSTEISMLDLVKTVEKTLNKKLDYTINNQADNYKTEPLRRVPDITKAKTELGFRPTISLESGLKRFFEV